MKTIKDLVREYFNETIITKRKMRKRITQLEDELKEARQNEKYAIEQKDKYKEKIKKMKQRKEK